MALPAAYFASRGLINGPLGRRLTLLFLMGGTQGLVGWWMVRSGFQVGAAVGSLVMVQLLRRRPERLGCRAMLYVKVDTQYACCSRSAEVSEHRSTCFHVQNVYCFVPCAGAGGEPGAARVHVPHGRPPGHRLHHLLRAGEGDAVGG